MRINHNISALNTLNQLEKVNNKTAKAMERLSSGLRINSAADDAAGLAIANKMDAQVKGLRQANRNTMDGVSMIQTAEGALNEVHAMLQRMRELSVQAANGTNSDDDRAKIQQEICELTSEINRVGHTTEFNTKPLLNGQDDKTDFFINEIKAEYDATNDITMATLKLPSPITDEDLEKLKGKTITLQPQGLEITFGEKNGVSPNAIVIPFSADIVNAKPEQRAEKIAKEMETILDGEDGFGVEIVNETEVKFTYPGNGDISNEAVIKNGGKDRDITVTLQIGANANQNVDIKLGEMTADSLGLTGLAGEPGFCDELNATDGKTNDKTRAAINVSTQEGAQNAITAIDRAIGLVSEQRSLMGATQNRLEHTVNNLAVSEENLTASMSRIQDADMAQEMATFTQQNVLSQAANAMLAQANQIPQQVLQLLQR